MNEAMRFLAENAAQVTIGVLITALIGAIGAVLIRFRAFCKALLAVNHDRLYQACTFYILTGQITTDEMKNLDYLYSGYHALGGNGTGTELYERCQKLPIVQIRDRHTEQKAI